jgi:hypothetical protein
MIRIPHRNANCASIDDAVDARIDNGEPRDTAIEQTQRSAPRSAPQSSPH